MNQVVFWRKPNPFVDTRWHAFREFGRGFNSLCGVIYASSRVSSDRDTMPSNGRCAKCVQASAK